MREGVRGRDLGEGQPRERQQLGRGPGGGGSSCHFGSTEQGGSGRARACERRRGPRRVPRVTVPVLVLLRSLGSARCLLPDPRASRQPSPVSVATTPLSSRIPPHAAPHPTGESLATTRGQPPSRGFGCWGQPRSTKLEGPCWLGPLLCAQHEDRAGQRVDTANVVDEGAGAPGLRLPRAAQAPSSGPSAVLTVADGLCLRRPPSVSWPRSQLAQREGGTEACAGCISGARPLGEAVVCLP